MITAALAAPRRFACSLTTVVLSCAATLAVGAAPAAASPLPPQMHTVAGGGSCSGPVTAGGPCDGVKATSVPIGGARSVAALPGGGYLYIDYANDLVRDVSPSGIVTTVAGTSIITPTLTNPNALSPDTIDVDNVPATSSGLDNPVAVAALPDGSFVITEYGGSRVRLVSPGPPGVATITTIAGIPPNAIDDGAPSAGDNGSAGVATSIELNHPSDAEPTASGGVLIADTYNHRIMLLSSTAPGATISEIAGDGTCDDATTNCNGLLAADVALGLPDSVSELQDGSGGYLFTESDLGEAPEDAVREVSQESPAGSFSTVAGEPGDPGYAGDGGPATAAQLRNPEQVVSLSGGGFLIADTGNEVIRQVSPSGTISTIAGDGLAGYAGDGGDATAASLDTPVAAAPLANGNLLIADEDNGLIREITIPSVSTFALNPPAPNGSNGWYRTAPTVTVSATEKATIDCEVDPVQAPPALGAIPPGCPLLGQGVPLYTNGVHMVYAASQNSFGDQENPVSLAIPVDIGLPTVTCSTPEPEFVVGNAVAHVTASVSDSTSGPAEPQVSSLVDTATLGAQTVTLSGSNNAGSVGSAACPYFVKALQLASTPKASIAATSVSSAYRVTQLVVKDIPAGASVEATCTGAGCPFVQRTHIKTKPCPRCGKPKRHERTVNLAPLFARAALQAGAKVAVIITKTNTVGRYVLFTIRNGKPPTSKAQCLAPGQIKPGKACMPKPTS